jgi:hypothetical protein
MINEENLNNWEEKKSDISFFESMKMVQKKTNKSLGDDEKKSLGEIIAETLEFDTHGGPTPEDIQLQYNNLIDQAGPGGSVIKTINSMPTRAHMIKKAENSMRLTEALAEFLDNIFDNYTINYDTIMKERSGNADLNIEIRITNINPEKSPEENGEIVILENSGGVKKNNWVSLVQYGMSGEEEFQSIGTWGEGAKLALAALGRWNIFQTRHLTELEISTDESPTPVQIQFGDELPMVSGELADKSEKKTARNYYHLNNDEWHIDVQKAKTGYCTKEGNEGTTNITIKRLTQMTLEEVSNKNKYQKSISNLAQTFANKINECKKLGNSNISITITNDVFETDNDLREIVLEEFEFWENDFEKNILNGDLDDVVKELSFLPGFEPMRIKTKIHNPDNNDEYIEIDSLFGIPLENISNRVGVVLWGNGRLFDGRLDSGFLGINVFNVPNGYTKATVEPQWRRFLGLIKIKTNHSHLIPWNGPVKWGFNTKDEKQIGETIQDFVASVMTRYIYASGNLTYSKLAYPGVPGRTAGHKLLEIFSHSKDKVNPAPERYELDCSKDIKEGFREIQKEVKKLTEEEVINFISHYEETKIREYDDFDISIHSTLREKSSLAIYKNILMLRQTQEVEDELITDAKTLAFWFSPKSFIIFKNLPLDFEKMSKDELEKLCQEKGISIDNLSEDDMKSKLKEEK